MNNFFASYLGANVVCAIIFGIFLVHDLLGVDRQEKQIKYDHALVAFILYFISDSYWAAVEAEIIPKNTVAVVSCNFSNYILMATVTYMWLRYVMAVENSPNRERRLNKFAVLFPFIVSTVVLVALYIVSPRSLISEDLEVMPAFNIFLIVVPCINIAAVILRTVGKAWKEKNPVEKKKHVFIGTFPLLVVFGGIIQMAWLPYTPIFCFSCTLLMITLYIQSLEAQVSTDPLTSLNNRAQLMRFVTQQSNLHIEGKKTVVTMFDADGFKSINDTYGHAEGDHALTIMAESMKEVVSHCGKPAFVARYGGDEFVMIIFVSDESEVEAVIKDIRVKIEEDCKKKERPYIISVSAGFDELLHGQDTFQKCLQRADKKLYLDKAYSKLGTEK